MHFDETFYVGLGLFVVLAICAYYGVFKMLGNALDNRAKGIEAELNEAQRLRQEAEGVLADYKRRQSEAEKEAAAIVSAAQADAERYAAESKAKLDEFVTRRTKQAELKIKMAEEQAMADVRATAADAAVSAATALIGKSAKGKTSDGLIASGIAQVKSALN